MAETLSDVATQFGCPSSATSKASGGRAPGLLGSTTTPTLVSNGYERQIVLAAFLTAMPFLIGRMTTDALRVVVALLNKAIQPHPREPFPLATMLR